MIALIAVVSLNVVLLIPYGRYVPFSLTLKTPFEKSSDTLWEYSCIPELEILGLFVYVRL